MAYEQEPYHTSNYENLLDYLPATEMLIDFFRMLFSYNPVKPNMLIGVAAPQRLGGPLAVAPTWREQGVDLADSLPALFPDEPSLRQLGEGSMRHWHLDLP
jgi:hypothetical protein